LVAVAKKARSGCWLAACAVATMEKTTASRGTSWSCPDAIAKRHDRGQPRPEPGACKLALFDGAYLRFTGQVRVERYRHGDRVEEFSDDAIWELMYFGHAR
jgi:hypothetical protein